MRAHRLLKSVVLMLTAFVCFNLLQGPAIYANADGIPPIDQELDLIAHWKLDEAAGSYAYDEVGDNNGTISGATWVDGFVGDYALSFDGNDYVDIAPSAGYDSELNIYDSDMTISAWVKTNGTGGTIISRAKPGYITYRLYLTGDGSKVGLNTYRSPNHWDLTTGSILEPDTWYYVVGVLDRDNDTAVIYVNGVERARDESMTTDPYSCDATTKIGCRNNQSDYPFTGIIDDVKVYGQPLSETTVKQLYDEALDLLAYWKLDEAAGSCAYDEIWDNNGTVDGATWVDGFVGDYALSFDGNDYVNIAPSAGYDSILNIYNSDMTMSAWVKTSGTGGTIISRAKSSYITYRLYLTGDGSKVGLNTYRAGTGHWSLTTDSILDPNVWYYVVGVLDRDNDTAIIYVNGVEQARDESMTTDPYSCDATTKIGCRNNQNDYPFTGLIDDVKIYGRTLPETTVKQLYNEAIDLLAHWKLDEAAGQDAYDSVMYNDGDIDGATWVNGFVGDCALSFDGDDYVNIAPSAGYDSILNIYNSDTTISAWVKTSGTGGTIISRAKSSYITYRLYLTGDGSKAGLNTYRAGAGHWSLTTGPILDPNTWYYVVGVLDRDNDTAIIYVNGVEQARDESMTTDPYSCDATTKIGCRNNQNDYPFTGLIDDVKIYGRALPEAIVQQAYDEELKLLAHWKLDEGTGQDAYDSVMYNDGDVNGASWVDGFVGDYALSFDGDDYVDITPSAGYDSELNIYDSDMTISAWVKANGAGGTIVSRAKSHYIAYRLYLTGDGSGVGLNTYRSPNHWDLTTGSVLDPNIWYYVVGVLDRDNDTAIIYVNGVEQARDESMTTDPYSCDATTKIGCRNDQNDYPFTGLIDDVKIYGQPLPEATIQQLYNEDIGLVAYWKLDEGTGQDAYDSVMYNHGDVNGASWVDGFVGDYALSFDGNDYVDITPSAGYDSILNIYNSNMSLSACFRTDGTGGTIVARAKPHYTAYRLYVTGDGSKVGLNTYRSPNHWDLTTGSILDPNTWYHVVGVLDRDNDTAVIYVNGVERARDESMTTDPYSCDATTKIGCRNDENDFPFTGIIDDVGIHLKALNSDAVKHLYSDKQ